MYVNHLCPQKDERLGEQTFGLSILPSNAIPLHEPFDDLSERLYKVSVRENITNNILTAKVNHNYCKMMPQVCKEANDYHAKYAAYQTNSWMPAGLSSFYGGSSDKAVREYYDQRRKVTRSLACFNDAFASKKDALQVSSSHAPHMQHPYQTGVCNQSIIPNIQDPMTVSHLFSFLPYDVGTHDLGPSVEKQMCTDSVWKPTTAEAKRLVLNMGPNEGRNSVFESYERCYRKDGANALSPAKNEPVLSSKSKSTHHLQIGGLNADTADNWRSSSLKAKGISVCFQRPCTGTTTGRVNHQNPQEGVIFSKTNRHPQEVPATADIRDYERRRLLALVEYYKFTMNNGFGLIPIINSFTARHKYVSGTKKRDFCPQIPDSCENTVLYEVEFLKSERWALFQGIDVLAETGESLHHCLDKQIILEMDGGIDLATLRSVEYMPLTPGLQEIPFMPVLRRPNKLDMDLYLSKERDESHLLKYCRKLLTFPEYAHYKMNVVNVELQIDRKKLIVFAEFVHKIQFNDYVKTLYEYCKNYFRGTKPRIFIQNKFVANAEFTANVKKGQVTLEV